MLEIENVTKEDVVKLKATLNKLGASVTSPNEVSTQFYINGHGIRASCNFKEDEQLVEMEITAKPFYLADSVIVEALKNYIEPVEPKVEIEESDEVAEES